jgi:hypothetical protein
MNAGVSGIDKVWLQVTGHPMSVSDLDANIQVHEDALVNLGFLRRENLPAQMVAACSQTLETLDALRGECPWYHAETISTNLVLTACARMLDRWHKRSEDLGW